MLEKYINFPLNKVKFCIALCVIKVLWYLKLDVLFPIKAQNLKIDGYFPNWA